MKSLVLAAVALILGSATPSALQRQTSIFGFTMEEWTVWDAEATLGPSEGAIHSGHEYLSCYVGRDGTVLVLEDQGMGMGISGFQLLARKELADFTGAEHRPPLHPERPMPEPKCAQTAKLSRATTTGGGLHLGMKAAEVQRLVGHPPTAVGRSTMSFVLEDHERPVSEGGAVAYPTASMTIDLDEQDRVVGVRVWYSSIL